VRQPMILLVVLAAIATAGCVHNVRRQLLPPQSAGALDHASPYLKVHMRDGSVYVLAQWSVDSSGRSVAGQGERLGPDRLSGGRGRFAVPMDSVALFETNVTRLHPGIAALAVVTGASLAVTIYCAANPKACFGSCPTFYVTDGERDVLQAEGFSGSVAPALEATDLDALPRSHPRGREVRLTMRNEALETQVVRRADLLAVPRPAGGRVLATADGKFRPTEEMWAPTAARGPEGDCFAALRALDGAERSSAADSSDLAAREVIELEFAPTDPAAFGVVIGARQSLLSTYLFYQALAWMGRSAGEWFAALECGDARTLAQARAADLMLGDIEVELRDATGRWVTAGRYAELGPLATDVQVVPLPTAGPGPVRVRLTLTRGAWRLDEVALARLGPPAEPLRLEPERVLRDAAEDAGALAALRGAARPLTTLPGDSFTLIYRLPGDAGTYEFFLQSRGYYLEWMRQEWLAEEDPERLALLFLDPRASLRQLAPEFKRWEPGMETAFWGSRYARP
jgi:hypothetical protein